MGSERTSMGEGITYQKSGVDIEAGERLVTRISPLARKTFSGNVIQDIGSFGALFSVDTARYKDPVLVSGTDGVGTKLKIAFQMKKHDTVGIDLVAMCVNDILTSGADPAFFLDYFATGKLDVETAETVISGIAEGCRQAHCSLIGGETAEMPGFYAEGEYDIAGFAVGIVDRGDIIDGSRISGGEKVIGLSSSGIHSNGYSLARNALFNIAGYSADTYIEELGKTVGEELLIPTRIYVDAIRALKGQVDIKAMAHITGGGIPLNLIRSIPDGFFAIVDDTAWEKPSIFNLIERIGKVPLDDMRRTFNMGIGYALVVPEKDVEKSLEILIKSDYNCYVIAQIQPGGKGVRYA
ncbi:MAG: phosphoribosylformylglycinamidine cyclo-ligase [Thermoplasmata archaeon M9B2D]|nr:MAG: phosphoribosylformylglycinamidine cyclo-ligase [Thermoplasmata archaeon M9B2D]